MSKKSFKDIVEPFLKGLPEVKQPLWHIHFKRKLAETLGILVLYFILANVPLFGLSSESIDIFKLNRAFYGGSVGSLLFLGASPIIFAWLILQLLVGSGIIKLDMSDPRDQALYQGAEKLLIFIMIVVETLCLVLGGFIIPDQRLAITLGVDISMISLVLFIQIAFGGVLIYFMDEVVSKRGIGRGVNLIILASISQRLVHGLFNWELDPNGWAIGIIPRWIQIFTRMNLYEIFWEGINFLFEYYAIALIATIIIFFVAIYLECTRIEIPLAHAMARGARRCFPIKLNYAGSAPTILVWSLITSIQMIGMIIYYKGIAIFGTFSGSHAISGMMYYLSPIEGFHQWIPSLVYKSTVLGHIQTWQIALHVGTYIFMWVIGSMIFTLLWINNTTGMGSKGVASQIYRSGLQIPGQKRSPGVIERMMEDYIPKIAIMGSLFTVGLILLADFFGTIGDVGGAALLVAITITYCLYEDVASEQRMEMFPAMRRFFGEG